MITVSPPWRCSWRPRTVLLLVLWLAVLTTACSTDSGPAEPGASMATPTVIPGQVVDPEGQPVAEARVFFGAGPAEVPDIAAVTSEEGRFSLTAPVPGDYTIVVAADGYAASETDVSASGGRNVDITIELRRAT